MNKQELIDNLKRCRKKFGKNSKKTYQAIYRLVKLYPYYEGYDQEWFNNNYHNL